MSGRRWRLALALALGACTAPRPLLPPAPPAPGPGPASIDALVAAIELDAKRSDNGADAKTRVELAASASRDADACLSIAPQAAACLYGRAIAFGLEARAHPIHAGEALGKMLQGLAQAESADPGYDEAGPARVRALVLIRAPGWPLGPGDAESGLVAARRAVGARPLYPPNQLALAEALTKTGDAAAGREAYARAYDLALALPEAADRDAWLREANQALHPNGK